ncbi:hypothetical protein LTR06_002605 [Exophiala xenobiotica]|nr:hypothetical protein LTR06_002605 [Exophiala xenobiotica]
MGWTCPRNQRVHTMTCTDHSPSLPGPQDADTFYLRRLEPETSESTASWMSVWRSFLQQFHSHTPANHPQSVSPTLEPISDMIRALFAVASTIHHLQHRTAFLAVPDFVIESTYAVSLIDPLLSGAGLHGFQSRRRAESRAALLGLYQLQHCYGIHVNETHQISDIECEKYNGRLIHSFLSIQLDASYFGLHQMYRNDGLIAISENMTEDHFDRGTNSLNAQDPDHYWSWVKDRVSHFSRHGAEPIDLLILHGTGVTRPKFLQLVREVFTHNDKIKAEEYLRTAEEHAYAASKGAAQIAKTGMWTNFEHCIPRYSCPLSEHAPPEFQWRQAEQEPREECREEL